MSSLKRLLYFMLIRFSPMTTSQGMMLPVEKSMVYRKRKKHLGLRGRRRTIAGRKFDGTPIPSRIVG
jgi:hypothetical protein